MHKKSTGKQQKLCIIGDDAEHRLEFGKNLCKCIDK